MLFLFKMEIKLLCIFLIFFIQTPGAREEEKLFSVLFNYYYFIENIVIKRSENIFWKGSYHNAQFKKLVQYGNQVFW